MKRPRRQSPLLIALYLNAALLAAVLIVLLTRGSSPNFSSTAFGGVLAPQPIAGGANLYLMPAQFSANHWGCYVLDIDTQTLCAYRYNPTLTGADLQLVAARRITYDRRLTNFNSTDPSWMEVKKWVEQAAEGIRGQDTGIPPSKNEKANNEQSAPSH